MILVVIASEVRANVGSLLVGLVLVEAVLARGDDYTEVLVKRLGVLDALTGCEDPPVVENSAAAEMVELDVRRQAPLQGHQIGKLAGLRSVAAHDSGVRRSVGGFCI